MLKNFMIKIWIASIVRFKIFLSILPVNKCRNYCVFIILGSPRTGSTLLHTYLNTHPNIWSLGEAIGMDFSKKVSRSRYDPIGYFENIILKPFPKQIQAVGFKVFYQYANIAEALVVIKYLQKMKHLKVIHLYRKNRLRSLVSLKIAERTQIWSERKDSIRSFSRQKALEFPAEVCLKDLKKLKSDFEKFKASFAHFDSLEICYEDLIEQQERVLTQVQYFLGTTPRNLYSLLKKQNPEPLKELISNYGEIEKALSGTKWESYLS